MKYINVPGLYNSGADHWQTKWEELHKADFIRVNQDNWIYAYKRHWVQRLQQVIASVNEPMILIGHSLGCITIRHWLNEFDNPLVKAVFLVAPADVENSRLEGLCTFAPIPNTPIAVDGYLIASTNDPYAAVDRAATWSAYWGTRFISLGNKGHINANSNLGNWEEGWNLLQELTEHAKFRRQTA
jgi:predicted alpha/beta hydrolase family esterase